MRRGAESSCRGKVVSEKLRQSMKAARTRRERTEFFSDCPPSVTLIIVGMAEMEKGGLRKAFSGVFHLRANEFSTRNGQQGKETHSCLLPTKTNVEFFSGTNCSTSPCTSAQSGHHGRPVVSSREEKKTR